MIYKKNISWLNNHQRFGIRLGLERIQQILKKLENPQNQYPIIHIAGTNGKGSVCNLISSILQKAGFKVGVYTSPHLIDFSERIKINNKQISKKHLNDLIEKIKPIVHNIDYKTPTYFELTTALTFEYFKQIKVDIAIIEVGLGGKYDATNIVKPICSVITNVELEHQNILGKTIKEITIQKAGIIKKEIPVITAAEKKALKIIKKTAEEKKSPLIIVNKKDWKRKNFSEKKQVFDIKTKNNIYEVETKLLGKYQGENIAIAVKAVEQLNKQGFKISKKQINDGIKNASNPGRTQLIQKNPYIIVDGAHNSNAAKKISLTVQNDFKFHKLILVAGILKDKNIRQILEKMVPFSDEIIITQPKNNRAADPEFLKKVIKKIDENKKTTMEKNVQKAIIKAINNSQKDDLILITGSLYTVGEALKFFKKIDHNKNHAIK